MFVWLAMSTRVRVSAGRRVRAAAVGGSRQRAAVRAIDRERRHRAPRGRPANARRPLRARLREARRAGALPCALQLLLRLYAPQVYIFECLVRRSSTRWRRSWRITRNTRCSSWPPDATCSSSFHSPTSRPTRSTRTLRLTGCSNSPLRRIECEPRALC